MRLAQVQVGYFFELMGEFLWAIPGKIPGNFGDIIVPYLKDEEA